MANPYDEFQEEIKRLENDVDYYKNRYELIVKINESQNETIRTYAKLMKILEAELKKVKGEEE